MLNIRFSKRAERQALKAFQTDNAQVGRKISG